MSGKQIFIAVVVLFALYTAYDSMFIVTETQQALVLQLGEIVGKNYEPGLHFKLPYVQNVVKFDDQLMTLTGTIERVLTSENKNLSVSFYVMWEIRDTVNYYLSSQGSKQRARHLIIEIVENDLLAQFSQRTMQQAIDDDHNEIVAAVQVLANRDTHDLGIHIEDIRILRLELPKNVRQSVYARMRSARQKVIKALRAKGEAAAQRIRADAERQRSIILAKAYKKAQKIRGEGDAKAAAIYAEAYSKAPEFYEFLRSLQLYRKTVGEKDILLLEPEGKLFQYFNPPVEEK